MTGLFDDDDMQRELLCSVSFTTRKLASRMRKLKQALVNDQGQLPSVCLRDSQFLDSLPSPKAGVAHSLDAAAAGATKHLKQSLSLVPRSCWARKITW